MFFPSTKQWNRPLLILLPLCIALAIFTLFYPPTLQAIWLPIDIAFFKLINRMIETSPFGQAFWALANHQGADILEDFVFAFFLLWLLKITPKEQRAKKGAQFLAVFLFCLISHLLINELLFRTLISVPRASPTYLLENCTRLSEKISWIKVKDHSMKSFPSDHATTALYFTMTFLMISPPKIARLSTLYGIFLCMPRMVVGAHWLTDVLLGSGSIVLLFGSWMFCTPLAFHTASLIERFFRRIGSLLQRKKTSRGKKIAAVK